MTTKLPQGTPISRDFQESPTLDELAQSQHVQPLADARALFGTWPGEDDDGFEASIDELRHPTTTKGASRLCRNLAEGEPYSMCDCMFHCSWQHHCLSLICRFEAARMRREKCKAAKIKGGE